METDPDTQPRLELHLLGPFGARAGGRDVEAERWKRRKPLALVKLLALQRHHRLHREQVMDALWPDLDPDAASNQLYKALHLARRALEPDLAPRAESRFLATRDQTVALVAPGGVWVDADAFEELAAAALRSDDPQLAAEALALYADDLLPDDPYEEWAASRREGLKLLRVRLLHHAAERFAATPEAGRAIELYEAALAADAADECAHRGLMRVHARAGRRHLARQQYRECVEALRRELDAGPDAVTSALAEAIEAGALDPPPLAPLVAVALAEPAAPVEVPRVARRPAPPPPAVAWRRAVAILACALVVVGLLLPFATVAGKLRHKLERFVAKAVSVVEAGGLDAPHLLSLHGRLDHPGARLEALDSISGWATIADGDGRFTLLDVQWRAGTTYEIVCSTGPGSTRVLRVKAPELYPSDGVLDLGDVAFEKGRVVDASSLYGVNSVSYLDYDVANAAYYRGVVDALTLSRQGDDERIDALNRFVASRFTPALSPLSGRTARGVFESGSSNSGALAVAMATLCRAGGYGVRLVDMAEQNGERRSHMIVEVFYAGEWHAYDPAYGLAVRDAGGRVVDYETLRRNPALISTVDYAAAARPGWETNLIPELYVSGIHHLYVFRTAPAEPAPSRERDRVVPVSL